jgi:hypothetical protein
MAAIAVRVKAPILVVNGADIPDDQTTLIKWLLTEICPHYGHAILLPPLGRSTEQRDAPL